MFNPLGALGSFGSGAVEGFGTGMDLADKYRTQKGAIDFYQALQQSLGDVSALGSLGTPDPGAPSARPQPTDAGGGPGGPVQTANLPPLPQQAPGVMPGAFPPMQAAMQPGQAGVAPGQPGAQRQPFPLAAMRDRVRQELESTPGLPAQLDRITTAEVGRDPTMRQMFQESVINRAGALQQPLAQVLADRSYFPGATFRRAAREGGTGQGVSPEMWASTAPANLSGYATGNASIDPRTGRPVGFAGGPQTAFRGGEQYGIEGRTLPAMQAAGYGGPGRTALGRGGPQGPGGQAPVPESVDKGTLGEALRYLQTGQLLPMQHMAQLIERAHPNASPMEKFYAMKAGLKLMNGAGQQQFSQMMQLLNYKERLKADTRAEEAAGRAERHQEIMEGKTQQTEAMQLYNTDPQVKAMQPALNKLEARAQSVEEFSNTAVRMGQEAERIANLISTSPKPIWQAVMRAAGKMTGNPQVDQLTMQLEGFKTEIQKILAANMGNTMAVSTRQEADKFARSATITPQMIHGLITQFKRDAQIRREEVNKQRDKYTEHLDAVRNYYLSGAKGSPPRYKGDINSEEYWGGGFPEQPGTTQPYTPAPGVTITPVQ